MKEQIKKQLREGLLNESSISRILNHIQNFDCAIITAFRNNNTTQENQDRNKELKALLLHFGYGTTHVAGTYIEDYNTKLAKEVKEDSLFVVNLKNDSEFERNVAMLGWHYHQDCIIVIKRGGQSSYLLGTNETGYPGLNKMEPQGAFRPKQTSQFMTKYKGQPFTFAEGLETYQGLSRMGRMAVTAMSKRILGSEGQFEIVI